MTFRKAIVRKPGSSLIRGIRGAKQVAPDYKKAQVQHRAYIEALENCGLEVDILNESEQFPDSVFIEDIALCTSKGAVICRPGASSRLGEELLAIEAISRHFSRINTIKAPGTVEAGDIMMVGDTFYIGLSDRTNNQGADQMIAFLKSFGLRGISININEMLHLKSGVSYLENNKLLVCNKLKTSIDFRSFDMIIVPDEEEYASNSVWVNGNVLVPKGYPVTASLIEKAGYNTIILDVSEFRKLDGGLSCLSLRF